MGHFLDVWDRIENALSDLIGALSSTNHRNNMAICNSISVKQKTRILTSLSTLRLDEENTLKSLNILERVSRANSKRNAIVHGKWIIETAVWEAKGVTRYKTILLREINPVDYRIRKRIGDLRNQAERLKYSFKLRQINAAARDNIQLFKDISEFSKDIVYPLYPPNFET